MGVVNGEILAFRAVVMPNVHTISQVADVHMGSIQGEARVVSLVIVDVAGNQTCFATDADATTCVIIGTLRTLGRTLLLHLLRSRLFTLF